MKIIDKRFDAKTLNIIEGLVGKTLRCIKSDPFVFSPMVYGIVGVYIDSDIYALTNFVDVLDYYGTDEGVAVFRFEQAEPTDVHSYSDADEWLETPVNEKITAIRVVNETQQLFHRDEQIYEVYTVRGLIFQLESGREISFEKAVWFSEMIAIMRGYELIGKFTPTDDFLEGWEDSPEYTPKCFREITTYGKWIGSNSE